MQNESFIEYLIMSYSGQGSATNSILTWDGTKWASKDQSETTSLLNVFTGDSGSGGVKGLVPAPAAGDAAAGKFLKADGLWTIIPGISGPVSSTNTALVRWNGTGGDTVQDSDFTLSTTLLKKVSAAAWSIEGADSTTGQAITIQGGDGSSSIGGPVNINGGTGTTTGGSINITAGTAGGTSSGGAISITGGPGASSGQGGSITITGGTAVSGKGGSITLQGRTNTGSGGGGDITINSGGVTNGTQTCGSITITAATNTNTSSGTGGSITMTAGGGFNSGDVTIKAGDQRGSFSGDVLIQTQDSTSGAGGLQILTGNGSNTYNSFLRGGIRIKSGAGNAAGRDGGYLEIVSGNGSSSADNGGNLVIQAGDIGTTNNGNGLPGNITITAGECTSSTGGSTNGCQGGSISLTAGQSTGTSTVKSAGAINITAGNGVGTNSTGGDLNLTSGNATGTGVSGNIILKAGRGGATDGAVRVARNASNVAVAFQLEGNNGNEIGIKAPSSVTAHTLTMPGANASGVLANNGTGTLSWSDTININSVSATAGNVLFLYGGASSGAGAGSGVQIQGGAGVTTGSGGSVQIYGGDGVGDADGAGVLVYGRDASGTGNNNGGSITLTPGAKTGTGLAGTVLVNQRFYGSVSGGAIQAEATYDLYLGGYPGSTTATSQGAIVIAKTPATYTGTSTNVTAGSFNRIDTSGGGTIDVNLPTPSSAPGQSVVLHKITTDTNTFTVYCSSGNLIGTSTSTAGTTGITLGSGGARIRFLFTSDGTDWYYTSST